MITLPFCRVPKDTKCALGVRAKESKIGFGNLAGIQSNLRHTRSVETDLLKVANCPAGAIIVASQLALTTSSCLS